MQKHRKVAFPLCPVRKDPDTFFQSRIPIRHPVRSSSGISRISWHLTDGHIRMLLQKGLYHFLILQRRKGTGRIYHISPRCQQLISTFQNLRLNPGIILRSVGKPAFHHSRIPPEHSFSGAWSVDQHLLKKAGHHRCQILRCFRCDHGISCPCNL